jgi:hypothetical protein
MPQREPFAALIALIALIAPIALIATIAVKFFWGKSGMGRSPKSGARA